MKETSRVGSSETAQRCTAIQLLLSEVSRETVCQALIITEQTITKWAITNFVCRNLQQLIERLDQAILDVIDNPERTQKTTSIGTLI